MSIVTFKRKTNHYKDKVSSNRVFSLNGGYRNQGRVGQSILSRSITGTKFKGSFPLGHGGCCGTYDQPLFNINKVNLNNPELMKASSITTKGLIDTRIKLPTSVYNNSCVNNCLGNKNTVKDFSALNNNQSSNISRIKKDIKDCNCKINIK